MIKDDDYPHQYAWARVLAREEFPCCEGVPL
jgi:hypothetical protein